MDLTELRSKASFSNVVTEDQVKRRYRGLAIVESEKGFNSEEEIDEYVEKSISKLVK